MGVIMDTTSSDGIPDGIARGLEFDFVAFIVGLIVGVIVTLSIVGIVKYIKFIIKDNKEIRHFEYWNVFF